MTASSATWSPDGPTLSVGALGADLLRLGETLELLAGAGVELLHVDVMDGVFCPPMTVGPMYVAALADAGFAVDVHLMIDEPLGKVAAYVEAGARIVTFHVEGARHPHRVLQSLAGTGVLRGVALNPGTPPAVLEPLLDELELVLVLAVNPGWPGQRFLPATAGRLAQMRGLLGGRDVRVGVDGGITRENIGSVASMGADLIVSGSAVFAGDDPAGNARFMLKATGSACQSQSPPLLPAHGASEEEFDG